MMTFTDTFIVIMFQRIDMMLDTIAGILMLYFEINMKYPLLLIPEAAISILLFIILSDNNEQ